MKFNAVHPSFKHGENFVIGEFNHIHEGVEVGDNVEIKSYVELREGTIIGDECYIDSGVKSSGQCRIGNGVTLRYESIIARGTLVEDHVFIAPQLMTENLDHSGRAIGGAQIGVGEWQRKTEYRVFIGTNVTLAAGITIVPDVIIGSKANVRKDILKPGIYFGNPARRTDDPKRIENIVKELQKELEPHDPFEIPSDTATSRSVLRKNIEPR